MKYKDLFELSFDTVQKLCSVSFKSPSTNYDMFSFYQQAKPLFEFIENERIKLIDNYGLEDEHGNKSVPPEMLETFCNEFEAVLKMDIDKTLPLIPLTKKDITSNEISYPKNKDLWLSPKEINAVLNFREKQKKEQEKEKAEE